MNRITKDQPLHVNQHSSNEMLPAGWNRLDVVPEDTEVEVIDAEGNTAFAYPTYYPFKVIPQPPYTKWSSKVEPCEPYWDGGWMIACVGLSSDVGTVVGWRYCQPACR